MTKTIRLLLPVLAVLLSACTPTATDSRPTVTVTIEPLRFFTEHIAGPAYHVVTMVPQGSSPETYEPTPRQMVHLSQSPLYIKVGQLGFERTWMQRLQANAPDMAVADASEGIRPIEGHHGESDPHTWTSPRNALVMARNICKALSTAFPADSASFRQRTDSLCLRLADVGRKVDSLLAGSRGKAFLIYHPALSYLAADYGLRQLAIEQEGREPSAAQLEELLRQAGQHDSLVLLVQQEFNNRNLEVVARSAGARPVTINPLSYHWDKETIRIARLLK